MANKCRTRLASLTLLEIAAGVAISAVTVPALAQAPTPVRAYNWTGFYIGAHAGYRWADANFTAPAYSFTPPTGTVVIPARNENYQLNSGIFGFHGGYNFQVAPLWLIGIEGDWSWGNGNETQNRTFNGFDVSTDAFTLRGTSKVELTWQASIRGRLGYVAGPWLFYGTGGVAFTRLEWSDTTTVTTSPPVTVSTASWSADKTLTGWVIGGGVEYMFVQNWIGRVEYLYENFRDFTVPHGFNPQFGKLDLSNVQKIRFGISYKFGP